MERSMPVTARLSKRFYDRFGDEIANELVEWFNAVDAASRDDLRSMNELNFARSDAKMEQRIAEVNARIDTRTAELDARIDRFGAELNARIDKVAAELNARIDKVAAELNARIDTLGAELNARIDRLTLEIRADMNARFVEQTRWMALSWGTLLAAVIGLYTR
jgi:DNA anti-recombination protein RmuC